MIDYLVGEKVFSFSYQELKDKYSYFSSCTDEEFFNNLPGVMHFVCFVAYIKELPSGMLLSDDGIIHLLAHAMDRTCFTVEERRAYSKQVREIFHVVRLV